MVCSFDQADAGRGQIIHEVPLNRTFQQNSLRAVRMKDGGRGRLGLETQFRQKTKKKKNTQGVTATLKCSGLVSAASSARETQFRQNRKPGIGEAPVEI